MLFVNKNPQKETEEELIIKSKRKSQEDTNLKNEAERNQKLN